MPQPRKKPRKKSASELRENRKLKAAVKVFAGSGDERCAAKLLGKTMDAAYRALCHPDGITQLEKLCAEDKGAYWSLTRAQRKAILSLAAVGGVLPEIQFSLDENGNIRAGDLGFVSVPTSHRKGFLELLGKMEGDYIEKVDVRNVADHEDWVDRFSNTVDVTGGEEIDPLS